MKTIAIICAASSKSKTRVVAIIIITVNENNNSTVVIIIAASSFAMIVSRMHQVVGVVVAPELWAHVHVQAANNKLTLLSQLSK